MMSTIKMWFGPLVFLKLSGSPQGTLSRNKWKFGKSAKIALSVTNRTKDSVTPVVSLLFSKALGGLFVLAKRGAMIR
jgi:hypothetical protein